MTYLFFERYKLTFYTKSGKDLLRGTVNNKEKSFINQNIYYSFMCKSKKIKNINIQQ